MFAGYGIHASDLGYDDYAGLDVKGKVVLVLRFSPDGDDPASRFQPHMALRRKASEARAQGAVALLVATGPVGAKETAPVKISFDASFADSGLPVLGISTPLAEALFAGHGFTLAELQQRMNERKEPASRPLGVAAKLTTDVVQERADAVNVVALLQGATRRSARKQSWWERTTTTSATAAKEPARWHPTCAPCTRAPTTTPRAPRECWRSPGGWWPPVRRAPWSSWRSPARRRVCSAPATSSSTPRCPRRGSSRC